MSGTRPDRCGYTWPEDHEINDRPRHQNCCWRETMDGADHCVLHADPELVSKSIRKLQESRTPPEIREQTSIKIDHRRLTEALDGAKLSGVEMGDEMDFKQVTLRNVNLSNADVADANFKGSDLSDAYIWEGNLSGAFLRESDLSDATLWKVNLSDADFRESDLPDTTFWKVNLSDADLLKADLSNADLMKADLSDADLGGADLSDANLAGADLSDANLTNANLSNADLTQTDLSGAYLGGVDLTDAYLTQADLSDAHLLEADLSDARLNEADLSGTNLKNTTFHNAVLEEAILSRATLFQADFRGARLHGSLLGDVRIDAATQFLGTPNTDGVRSPHTCAAIFSKPCCVYDPNYSGEADESNEDKAKSVYQALEELSSRAAQTRLQSQCFVRRQDLHKNAYKTTLRNGPRGNSDADIQESEDEKETADSPSSESRLHSLEVRTIAGLRYARAKTARMTLLYGESPWRIIAWSIGFVVAMALVYPLNEWLRPVDGEPITYSRIVEDPTLFLESLYFSTLTFTTLGLGDYEPLGMGQAIATLNTAFGAILIALLVFVLGRRAAR